MSDQLFTKNLHSVLQRDQDNRQSSMRMHFASADENDYSGAVFEQTANKAKNIILTTGCGLPNSVDRLPVRFPSLIVPGLNMLRAYQNTFGEQFPITYQVYQAGDFIKNINNMAADKIEETSSFMQSYLETFTKEFYPDVASKVSFDFKKDVALEELEPITEFLKSTEDAVAQAHLEKINGYSSRGKNRGSSYIYTSANIYFNCMGNLKTDPEAMIIPVGGQKEIPFFYLTSLYHKEKRQDQNYLFPVSCNNQQLPSYFPYRQGDLTIGNLAEENFGDLVTTTQDLPPLAIQDFKDLLEPVGATLPKLLHMASSIKKQSIICA